MGKDKRTRIYRLFTISFLFFFVIRDEYKLRKWNCLSVFFFMCVCLVVLHSGDYYLFESDSEDEDVVEEVQKHQKHTPFQVTQTHTHTPTKTRHIC